jgi:tripartite-type tricarboxylate transporter receptor subunit TctC
MSRGLFSGAGFRCLAGIEYMSRDNKERQAGRRCGQSSTPASHATDASILGREPGPRIRMLMLVAAAIVGLLAQVGLGVRTGGTAFAQAPWPAWPITLVVPFAAGGPTDVLARLVGESMSRTLGQQVVIENVTGAGGTTASTRTMRAAPDGYTIMLGHTGTHAAAVAIYPKLAYDPSANFAPIGLVIRTPIVILGRKDLPAHDLGEFITYMRHQAGELTMAHAGMGSVSHLTCQLFNSIIGVSPKLMAFQGAGPAMNALVAGQVDYMCDQVISVVPNATARLIRVFAVATSTRNFALPDVPTSAEAGLPEFEVSAWNGLFGPKATPRPIIARLNVALVTALDDPVVRKRLLDLGGDIPSPAERSPERLAALVKQEIAKWTPILKGIEGTK